MIVINKLLRSRRRSIGLEVTQEAELIIRAPHRVPLNEIEKIVFKKRNWIINKQNFFRQCKSDYPEKRFIEGENFYYLGKAYRLKLVDEGGIRLSEYLEFPRNLLLNAKVNLVQWYKICAYERIKERADYYAKIIGKPYSDIKISNAKKRFGSCSFKGSLNFNWRMIMAPLEIIDYVVVHELTHLEERNHSFRFWNKVGKIMPDYKEKRFLLKNSHRLFDL